LRPSRAEQMRVDEKRVTLSVCSRRIWGINKSRLVIRHTHARMRWMDQFGGEKWAEAFWSFFFSARPAGDSGENRPFFCSASTYSTHLLIYSHLHTQYTPQWYSTLWLMGTRPMRLTLQYLIIGGRRISQGVGLSRNSEARALENSPGA